MPGNINRGSEERGVLESLVVAQDPEVVGMVERKVFLEHGQTAPQVPGRKHGLLPGGAE